MRRHAKAATVESIERKRVRPGRAGRVAALALLTLASCLVLASPGLAATVTDRPLLFSFDGSDTTAGPFGLARDIAIEESTGDVYVAVSGSRVVDKFNANGQALDYPAIGESSLDGRETPEGKFPFGSFPEAVAVDNSSANPGRLFVGAGAQGPLYAFSSAGTFLCEFPRAPLDNDNRALAVDPDGHLWVGSLSKNEMVEFANSGCPGAVAGSFPIRAGQNAWTGTAVDASGNIYVVSINDGFYATIADKYTSAGAFASTLDASGEVTDVAADQTSASGHVFTVHRGSFDEYTVAGTLIGSFGAVALSPASKAIAYNPTLDRVYIVDGSDVKAFGPVVTGTVPDATIEATTGIEVSKATFHGKVNPQSVPNSYHFEWKRGEGSNWDGASSSPAQTLPEDGADHAVSFNATGLAGGTTYQVRLVGVNTENHLRALSGVDTFTTTTAASAPAVTIDAPSSITATSAQISGTVNPKEDAGTTWRLQTSTDPACASGFSFGPSNELESEANGPVAVSEELTGLLPSEHYCVLIEATNSFGTTTSETKEFETSPVVPSQVFTAFAAPRTDTSARLNGYVNPEGGTVTYHFEYSEDGGNTWIALSDRQDTSGARRQIVVGEELAGLDPNTTYSYRFSAETGAGPASPQGEVKTFTTRSAAEMNPPGRGFELINPPDKGNQNAEGMSSILGDSAMTADGEKALWSVLGGAPGGNVSSGNIFLSERSAEGWRTESVIPPPAEQFGKGEYRYNPLAATPDASTFVFTTGPARLFVDTRALVTVRRGQGEEVIREFPADSNFQEVGFDALTLSEDGSRILAIEESNDQLVEFNQGAGETISVMPDGAESSCGLGPGSFPGTNGGHANQLRPGYDWTSTDFSRVYFRVQPNGECGQMMALYERDRESGETMLVDSGAFTQKPELIRVTPDGRHAYFLTRSQLDPADENTAVDVYRWDEGAGDSSCLTCIVPDPGIASYNGGPTATLVSDDFSHVYFESTKQLIPGMGSAGSPSIYSLSEGQLHFVADLGTPVGRTLSGEEARLSADGNVLVFQTREAGNTRLTADRLAPACRSRTEKEEELNGPGPCVELFLYDDPTNSLECVSCRHDGETTRVYGAQWTLGNPGLISDYGLARDGSTVAFITAQALVPRDVNNDADAYEWRNGVIRMITDGVSDSHEGRSATTVDAVDADGSDIMLGLVSFGLTGYEQDGLVNLYDARIGGGFPRPTPPAHCDGDSCQGPLRAAPTQAGSGSASYRGAGNLKPNGKGRCSAKRGKARKRCLRRLRRQRRCSAKRGKARKRCLQRLRRQRRCSAKRGTARKRCLQRHRRTRGKQARGSESRQRARGDARRAK